MSIVDLLDTIFVKSLLTIYDELILAVYLSVQSVGWAIVGFSIVLNLVMLPIYVQMERAKRKGMKRRDEMNAEVARMKAHYTGRERYFYVRTVHRVFNYRPLSAVLSSGDLYLQIIVFATVFRYLANQKALIGAGFLSISDLSQPDALLFGANVLPFLMTLLNVGSTLLYSADRSQRTTGFALAGLFLVLLYASPAGMVLYWTCNNAFSLARLFVVRKIVPLLSRDTVESLSRLATQE